MMTKDEFLFVGKGRKQRPRIKKHFEVFVSLTEYAFYIQTTYNEKNKKRIHFL
ncbi:MAG: hypothetical protein K0Q73_8911 [Paenibacillus sp.]|nr:hypothetical protein [Paenibacillus sp.]